MLFIFWCHPEKANMACLSYCANAVYGQWSTHGNYSTEYRSQLSRVINVSQKFILLITHSLCNPPDCMVSIAKCDALILKLSFASNRTVVFKSKLKLRFSCHQNSAYSNDLHILHPFPCCCFVTSPMQISVLTTLKMYLLIYSLIHWFSNTKGDLQLRRLVMWKWVRKEDTRCLKDRFLVFLVSFCRLLQWACLGSHERKGNRVAKNTRENSLVH